jgi:membrane-bound lytic murein transglycosylase B
MAAVLSLPLLAASSQPPALRSHVAQQPKLQQGTHQFAVITPASVAAALGDLRDFRLAARKPAASAPLRLPRVDLAAINVGGIPRVAAAAYVGAARAVAQTDGTCHLRWWLLAGIGLVESGHAASGGSRSAHWNGIARPPILGPVLDGAGRFAAIRDTDHGRYDGNPRWDRAVGPMQFLPSTWTTWGVVRSGAGPADPQDIRAASLAAAHYLCAGGRDLAQLHNMALAVYSYNHSFDYVRLVLSVSARYAGLDPAALGVNTLPTDRHVRQQQKRARHHRSSTTASGTQTTTASPSATASSASTPSPSASPSPTPTAATNPLPQPTPTTTITPLPTGPTLP